MHVGLSHVLRERDELDAARQHLQVSSELGEHVGLPQNRYRWRVAMARIREAEGDLAGALNLLDEAQHRYTSDFYPNVRPIAALMAGVWIAQGRIQVALAWARERDLSTEDTPSYLREFEHITLAKVCIAQATNDRTGGAIRDAMSLLDRLLGVAE